MSWFTKEIDLIKLRNDEGRPWSRVARLFSEQSPGRTQAAIQVYWSTTRKQERGLPLCGEDDTILAFRALSYEKSYSGERVACIHTLVPRRHIVYQVEIFKLGVSELGRYLYIYFLAI